MPIDPWMWPAGLGLLGLVFGSFIATLALRWPEGRSAMRGRSACDACGKALGPHELIPVLSYAVQRGRCRGCGATIARSHFLVELAGLAVGVSAGLAAPGPMGAAAALFGWLLLALAALDLAAFWLPDVLTGALALSGLAIGHALDFAPLKDRVIGGVAGFAALWIVALAYRRLRGREGLGGGDPKLFGAIGLWLGWETLPGVLLFASLIGLSAVILLRLAQVKLTAADRIPFGAPLAAAAYLLWLWLTLM